MALLKTNFAEGDVLWALNTTSTSGVNGITNKINLATSGGNAVFITHFPLYAGQLYSVGGENYDIGTCTSTWQNAADAGLSNHLRAYINWSDYCIRGATTKFLFWARMYFGDGGNGEVRIQESPDGVEISTSSRLTVITGANTTVSTGWKTAPTTGVFMYELGISGVNTKAYRALAAGLNIAPFWD